MIAYKNMMNEINNLKEPKPIIEKKHCIIKYPLHKIYNSDNKIIPYPKHKINYLVDNSKNFIRKYNENKEVANYTNDIDKLYSLDVKLKSDNDKPPDYYQYNMKNKTIEDLRLDAYQNENNIKSNMTILQEENASNKTINEIKTDEDDFQTNLNIILNEYKNKQNELNLGKIEPSDIENVLNTKLINIKSNKLTSDYNKLPIVFKTFSKPIKIIEPVKLTREEIVQQDNKDFVDSIFRDNIKLNHRKNDLSKKVDKMNEEQSKEYNDFIIELEKKELNKKIPITKEQLTSYLNNYVTKANQYIRNNIIFDSEPNYGNL